MLNNTSKKGNGKIKYRNKRYEGEKEKTENGTRKWMQERICNVCAQKKICPEDKKKRKNEWKKNKLKEKEKKKKNNYINWGKMSRDKKILKELKKIVKRERNKERD